MAHDWDQDIAALGLTEVEKNGLQVFRNYSRAFENHRIREFITECDQTAYRIDALIGIHEHIETEDPRILAVIVSAFADEQLNEMFKRELPEQIPGGRSGLLSGFGPLSRYSQRIQIAFAFDWVSRDILTEADKLRKLRNVISHNWNLDELKTKLDTFISTSMSPIETLLDDGTRLPREFFKRLDAIALFRVRLAWLVGRLYYECLLFPRALKARLDPVNALYGGTHSKLLTLVAGQCVEVTKRTIEQLQSNPCVQPTPKSGAADTKR